MAKENVGFADCPMCGEEMPVRKDKGNKLYGNCNNCGLHQQKGQGGQDWFLNNTRWIGTPPKKNAPPLTDKDDSGKAGAKDAAPAAAPNTRKGPAQPKPEATPPLPPEKKKTGNSVLDIFK